MFLDDFVIFCVNYLIIRPCEFRVVTLISRIDNNCNNTKHVESFKWSACKEAEADDLVFQNSTE